MLRGLTIWQPWASALLYGPKFVENRSWAPPPPPEGEDLWIAIHASKHSPAAEDLEFVAEHWEMCPRLDQLPRGCVLGVARIKGVYPADQAPIHLEADPWSFGPWLWEVSERYALREPHRVRGQQGLWVPDEQTTALCRMAVAAGRRAARRAA